MRELLLDERGRKPAAWHENLSADERAVFFTDVRTGAMRDEENRPWPPRRPYSCLVFASADAARTLCLERVERFPELRCEIFDHHGRAVLPTEVIVHERYRKHLSAQRNRKLLWIIAIILLVVSAVLLYIEYRFHGILIVAMIVGMNCIGVALRLIFLAVDYPEQSQAGSTDSGKMNVESK